MISSFDLENLGKSAATEFISGGKPLNTSILKLATTHNLNLQQVHRVVESANVDAYLNLIKTSEDKYVDFPLADAKVIYTDLTEPESSSEEGINDYEEPPIKTASMNLFPGIQGELEKTAGQTISYGELRKEASRLEGVCSYIEDQAAQTRLEFDTSYHKLWDLTKQATLTGENLINVLEIIKVAAPTYSDYIAEDFIEYAKDTMPHIEIDKKASFTGMINPKSHIYKAGEELEYYGDRFHKIASAFVTFADRYDELRKESSTLGGLKKLLLGGAETVGGASKGLAKALLAHKKLVLVGLGGAAAYGIGKSKGRREQGEILQRKMLSPKYRNQRS